MKRLYEFENILLGRLNDIEGRVNDIEDDGGGVTFKDFDRFLSSNGEIIYTYTSIKLGCEIKAYYKGFKHYGKDQIDMKLYLNYNGRD
jgi:hypothetical protein